MIEVKVKRVPKIEERVKQALALALEAGAEKYTNMIHDHIDQGKAFTPRTGHLQGSVGFRMKSENVAVVFAEAKYAPFVEFGTRPHVILPKRKKALRFFKDGKEVIVKKVNHPGSKPYPFFYADMERRKKEVAREFLRRFLEELHG